MSYRGRLIQRMVIVLERLNTDATGTGAGYDDRFGEPRLVDDGSQLGGSGVVYHTPIDIPCQVDRSIWGKEMMSGGGVEHDTEPVFTLHFKHLESLGLVWTSGELLGHPKLQIGDRVIQLKKKSGAVIISWESNPLYLTRVEDSGMGIDTSSPSRNLVFLYAQHRRKGEGISR